MSYQESDWERREQDLDIDQPAPPPGLLGRGRYQESDWERREERREKERGEGLSEWELSENSAVSEQELSRLKNTTPLRVFYIVVGIALLLLLIVGILGANVFHFW